MNSGMTSKIIAFITDFGLKDSYVSEMHAVVLSKRSAIRILDISHEVPSGDIKAAAYLTGRMSKTLPEGTIFVVVVDPGVGTDRQAVLLRVNHSFFIGPDNGVFSTVIGSEDMYDVRIIDRNDCGIKEESATFHGRDLFVPVALRIALGEDFGTIGKPGRLKDTFPTNQPQKIAGGLIGEVVYIDRFGNVITNLPVSLHGIIEVQGRKDIRFCHSYGEQPSDEYFYLHGSGGFIEISMNMRSAADGLRLKVGDQVKLKTDPII